MVPRVRNGIRGMLSATFAAAMLVLFAASPGQAGRDSDDRVRAAQATDSPGDPRTSVGVSRCSSTPCVEGKVRIYVSTASPAPVRIQLNKGERTELELVRGPGTYSATLEPGVYQVCFSQEPAPGWAGATRCLKRTVRVMAQYDVRVVAAKIHRGKARFTVVASGFAIGRSFAVIPETLHYRTYNDGSRGLRYQRSGSVRRGRLRDRQTFVLPRSPVKGQPSRIKLCLHAAEAPDGNRYPQLMVRRATNDRSDRRSKTSCG